jgi:hypothetical protein
MKTHTTNYTNTFIEVAEDCPTVKGKVPPVRAKRSIADIQYEIINQNPYKFTSDDVLFQVYAKRNNLPASEYKSARKDFFSKSRACLRASPLSKRYGWGLHFNNNSKVALFGVETNKYRNFVNDKKLNHLKAMRSSK